jgi:hypothetical protein
LIFRVNNRLIASRPLVTTCGRDSGAEFVASPFWFAHPPTTDGGRRCDERSAERRRVKLGEHLLPHLKDRVPLFPDVHERAIFRITSAARRPRSNRERTEAAQLYAIAPNECGLDLPEKDVNKSIGIFDI